MESTDTGAAPSDYYFSSDGQSDQMDCEDIVETNRSVSNGLGDTWLIGGRTDTRDINDDLSSEAGKLGLEAFIPANLSFKILHCRSSELGKRVAWLVGARCSVACSREDI